MTAVEVIYNKRCVNGDICGMSEIKMMFGPDSTKASVGINNFEGQPEALKAAEELGKNIAQAFNKDY